MFLRDLMCISTISSKAGEKVGLQQKNDKKWKHFLEKLAWTIKKNNLDTFTITEEAEQLPKP